MPGVDAGGQPAPPLSIFHAFYFISYTATTIGFGEIPGSFSDAQRLWVIVCIYLTVIGWSYSIVTLLALVQDKAFQNFLVVAGLPAACATCTNQTIWSAVAAKPGPWSAMRWTSSTCAFVVVELRDERVQELDLEFPRPMCRRWRPCPEPSVLALAGLRHAQCRGVLALTHDDEGQPGDRHRRPPVCSTRAAGAGPRRQPDDRSQHGLLRHPSHHQPVCPLRRLSRARGRGAARDAPDRTADLAAGQPMPPLRHPPEERGSSAATAASASRWSTGWERRVEVTVIDPGEQKAAVPGAPQHVSGLGTEAETLLAAGVDHAAGLVAGTDNGVGLSIAMTARDLPDLFVVMRQNRVANAPLFEAFAAGS